MPKIKYKDLARALRQDLGQDVANIDDVSLVQAWITDNPQYKNDVIFDGQVGRIAKRTGNLLEDLKTAEPLPRTAVAPQRGRSGFEAPMSTPFTGGFVGGEMAAPQRPAEDIEFLPTTYSNTLEGQRILDFTKGKKDVESIRDYFTSVAQEGAVGSESKLAKTAALRNALDVNLRFAEEQYNDLYPDAPLSWSDFMAKSSDPQLQQDREILGQELTSLFGKMKYYEAMGDEQSYNQAKQSADEIANQYDSLFGEFEQALQVASPLLEQVNQYGQELNQLNEEANKEAQDIEETSFFGKAALSLSRFGAGLGYVAADLFSTLGATGIGDKMKSGLMDSQLSTKDPRMAAFKAPYDSKKGGFTGGVGNAVGFIFEQGLNMIPAIAAFSTPYGRAAQTALATIGTTATTYDEYANEIDRAAIETGAKIDPQTRAALAGMASLKTGLIENVIPINKFIKLGMAKSFADDAVRALASGKSLEVAMRGAYQASKAFAAAQGVEISEEIIDQLAQETINESVRSQMAGLEQSDQFAARPAEFSDYKDIVVNTAIAVAPLAGVGFISNGARFKEDLYHHVGRKGDLDAVMDLFEENRDKFKGESYKKNTDRLKKVSSVYESIPQEFDDINARKVADNMLEIDRLDGQINNRTSSSQREAAEKKIANLQGEIDQIYREEQEKVAPTTPQAVTEEVPAELESQMPESDQNVLNVVSERIEPILNPLTQQMTNAEEIDMAEIEAVAEQMIDEQARILESENLSEEEKQSLSQLIELQIDNLLNYEFATTTTTEQTGQAVQVKGVVRTAKPGLPQKVSTDRFFGTPVTNPQTGEKGFLVLTKVPITQSRTGLKYQFVSEAEMKRQKNGEYRAQQGILKLGDDVAPSTPFTNMEYVSSNFGKDGNLTSVVLRDAQSGNELQIDDQDLALDIAIAESQRQIGTVPEGAFISTIQRVIPVEQRVKIFPNLRETGTTPAAVGVEPQTEQDVRQETNAPQEGRGQGEDAAPVPQEEGRQEGQVTPLDVAQEGETPPAAKRTRKTEQQKADESKAAAEELKKTLGVLQAGKKKPLFQRPGQKTEIDEDTQIEVASEEAGISPKNSRDLYRVNRELFGLNQSEAMSATIAMDKMIDVMANRAGVSKTEMYGRINFKKATEQDPPQGVKFQVDAWHGSPYQFDKFTTEKIGTGEGAQAFGWGLYFTDLEDIAKGYAKRLSGDVYSYDGKLISEEANNYLFLADDSLGENFNENTIKDVAKVAIDKIKKEYIPDLREIAKTSPSEKQRSEIPNEVKKLEGVIKELENVISSKEIKLEKNKALYKVSIHKGKTPDQYTWLEWDKPISPEVKEKILDFIEKDKKYGGDVAEGFVNTWKEAKRSIKYRLENNLYSGGQSLYEDIAETSGLSPKSASLFLLDAGIDGVRFPAESIARGATSDTARGFNYVVFDENAVSIEETIKFQEDAVKARGAMMITLDGQATIYALTDPNVSTPLHELAHVFEHYLTDEERTTVQDWAKTKDWTIKTSEAFARGFEKYLSEGQAPTPALQKIFDNFKQWLTDIYRGIVGSDIDVELNEPMRDLYAKMFDQAAPTQQQAQPEASERGKAKSAEEIFNSSEIFEGQTPNQAKLFFADALNDFKVPYMFGQPALDPRSDMTLTLNGAKFLLSENQRGPSNYVLIDDFLVNEDLLGTGKGRDALVKLIEYADKNGITLVGEPLAMEGRRKSSRKGVGLSQKDLTDFYKRYGFTKISKESLSNVSAAETGFFERKPQQQAQPEAQVSVDGTAKERRDKFFDEIEGMYRAFPFQPGFIISEKPNKNTPLKDVKILGRLSVYEGSNDGSLYIDEVQAQNFGERTGNGSKIMQIVSDMADKYGLTIELVASPISGNNMTGAGKAIAKALNTPEKLAKFYEKFGFVNVADNLGREEYSRITKELRSAGFSTVNPVIPPSRQLLMVRPPKVQQQAQPEAQVEATAKALEGLASDKFRLESGEETPTAINVDYGDISWPQSGLSSFNEGSDGKTYVTDKNGDIYQVSKTKLSANKTFLVTIKNTNGEEVGSFEFKRNSDGSFSSEESYTSKKGVGIATIAYDIASKDGEVIKPSKKLKKDGVRFWAKSISNAYHKAKADGSNPELVKAVEDLLVGEQQQEKPTTQPDVLKDVESTAKALEDRDIRFQLDEGKPQQQAQPKAQVEATAKALNGVDVSSLSNVVSIPQTLETKELDQIPRGETFQEKYAPEYFEKLKKDIKENGIKEPVTLKYYVKDNAIRLIEGHHRLKIAKELGIKNVPVKVDVVWGTSIVERNEDIKGKPILNPPTSINEEKYSKRNYAPSNIAIEELGYKNKFIAEAYHKAKKDGSNPELVQAVEDLLGKTTPEAKPEKTISEQRKEFRETAKKYFEGMKKMGVIFDAERNAAEDKAFIKALTDYIKLEIDNGMVTFKGFIDKASALTEELKDPKIVKFAKTVWAKEVVKAYPKVYAKLQRAQKALLDKELAEARQTLRDNLNKLLSRSSIYKRISSRTTERKVDKASADAINDMREEIKALGGVDALSDAELISLTKITEDFYKEGKANQQQIKNELKSAKKAVSESARDAITNQGEKTSVELQSAESALDFLLQSEGKNSNQVVMTTEQGVIVFESADDFLNYAFTEKTNKDGTKETVPSDPRATYGGIVTTPNPNVLEQRETKIGKMYRSSLGGGLIYLIDKLKGKNPSQATIDFFNGIEKAIFDGTTNQRKTNFKFRSARRQYIAKIFRPKGIAPGVLSKSRAEVRYSMYMMSTPSINGEPLVLTDENGVKLEGVSIGEVMYLYQLMKDPHFLTGDRKIGLSKKSMFDIIDFMNSSEGKLGKEVIEEDQISFKELADKASIILEANGISSDNIKPKKLNLDNYKDSPLVAEILGKIYGKNIPENIEYFPSSVESSETEQVPDVDALIDNSPDVNAVTAMAGFFIDRQPGGKVRIQNYGSQVLRYYSGMSNTIAKLPVLKLLQATFDKANKNLIGEYYGSSFLGEMKENIYRYVTMSQGKEWDIGLMKGAFGKYFTLGLGVQMFFNLGSAISQLASAPGPIIAYGIRNYVKGLALLWKNKNSFKTYYKGLWDSPLLQERFGSRLEMSSVFANIPTGERGVKETMNVVNKAIISLGILPTSFADAMSVMASLPIYVNEYEKNLETMNSEDAKTNAENETMLLAEKFLQTRREELMSSDEAKFRNTLYAFATIVPQMHRQALMAFKRMQRGEGDFSTNMSVFIWSSVGSQILFRSIRPVAEALFQGGDDEEERAKLKGDKRLRKAAVDIVSDATKSLSVTGAFLSVLVKTLYQFIDAEDDRSIVIKMADISPELIEAIPALSIKVRGLRDVAFSIQDEEQLKALTQGLQVLTNFPSEKIRMAAVQMSDGFTSDYINGMDAVLRLSGLISEDKAKEKIFAQMMAGEAAAISELSPAEIGKYTKRRKDEYNVIVSRLAKDYATATTDSQRNLATEKLFALVGGTTKYTDFDELSEQLFNRFDEKILEYSLPEDVLKVKKMPNVEKINFVAKEAMLKMKTDPQEAISYIQQLQVLGAIEGKEEEKIYEIIMRTPQ